MFALVSCSDINSLNMFKNKNKKGANTMDQCRECGEDLELTWNDISKCENNTCDLYFKKDQINSINHLENQKVLNDKMDNS